MDPQEQQSIEKESPTKTLSTTPEQTEQPPFMEPHVEEGYNGVKHDCAGREEEPKSEKKEEEEEIWESDALPPIDDSPFEEMKRKFSLLREEYTARQGQINKEMNEVIKGLEAEQERLRVLRDKIYDEYTERKIEIVKEAREKFKVEGKELVKAVFELSPHILADNAIKSMVIEWAKSLRLLIQFYSPPEADYMMVKGLRENVEAFKEKASSTWKERSSWKEDENEQENTCWCKLLIRKEADLYGFESLKALVWEYLEGSD